MSKISPPKPVKLNLDIGGSIFMGGIDLMMNKASGESWGKAIGGAALDAAFWYVAKPLAAAKMAVDTVTGIVDMTKGLSDGNISRIGLHPGQAFNNLQFNDSQQAYTLRQRNMQAIQQSRLNARSTLGNEARMLSNNFSPN